MTRLCIVTSYTINSRNASEHVCGKFITISIALLLVSNSNIGHLVHFPCQGGGLVAMSDGPLDFEMYKRTVQPDTSIRHGPGPPGTARKPNPIFKTCGLISL
jgi:hypothetical protein